jgi:hypothetical protein
MRLTKAEKEFILEKRRQEEEQKPKKIGFLKEDIYDFNGYSLSQDIRGCYYVSASLKDKMVTDFINSLAPFPNGGPGKNHHLRWNENYLQEVFEELGLNSHTEI